MKIYNIEEFGYERAMRGLARSFGQDPEKMPKVAENLAPKDRGHNKFLRMLIVYCEIEAPRFWWSEFDTYKVGTVAQSDSTMHTLKRKPLTQDNFEHDMPWCFLEELNDLIAVNAEIEHIKGCLPESFIQGRTVLLNYAVIREIILQRRGHKLPQWQIFIDAMLAGLKRPELLGV